MSAQLSASRAVETRPLSAHRAPGLAGRVRAPGDRFVSHCALVLGLLSIGETEIAGLPETEDVLTMAEACRALGATLVPTSGGRWRIHGVGIGGLLSPSHTLDFGHWDTAAALMLGAVAGHGITATFDGSGSLRGRPLRPVLAPLLRMGAEIVTCTGDHRLPLTLRGATDPVPIAYETTLASAPVKSAVLLAGLNAPGETTVIEAEPMPDHLERLLRHFGAEVTQTPHGQSGRRIVLRGRPELKPASVVVPGDPSAAAFPLVAALIVPGSDIVIEGVMTNPLRMGLLTMLQEMGADITLLNARTEGSEEVADLAVRHSELRGIAVPAGRIASLFDDCAALVVAAAYARGETRLSGCREWHGKAKGQLAALAAGLAANGVPCRVEGDDLVIVGMGEVAGGGTVAAMVDGRVAMAFLVMGMASARSVEVDGAGVIAADFPGFVPTMISLGANLA